MFFLILTFSVSHLQDTQALSTSCWLAPGNLSGLPHFLFCLWTLHFNVDPSFQKKTPRSGFSCDNTHIPRPMTEINRYCVSPGQEKACCQGEVGVHPAPPLHLRLGLSVIHFLFFPAFYVLSGKRIQGQLSWLFDSFCWHTSWRALCNHVFWCQN